jgi:hypothetical protein
MGEKENLAQGKKLRDVPHQMVAGGVEQHTRSQFWGSQGEQEGPKEGPRRWGGGAQWSRLLRPRRARRRCSSVLGKGRGGAGIQRRGLGRLESEGRRTARRRKEMAGGSADEGAREMKGAGTVQEDRGRKGTAAAPAASGA